MRLRACLVLLSLFVLLAPSSVAQIATVVPLPADLTGELDGVPYRIRVPANWNGTLLVYNYGYAEAFPTTPLVPLPQNEASLLTSGFALAVANAAGAVTMPAMPTPAGWNIKERMQNTVALTAAFRELVGKPLHTIVWGKSLGGMVALGLVEKFPGHYDGAIALCAPSSAPHRHDQGLDQSIAYAVAFDWNSAWGTPGDLRDDLNFLTEVYPHVMQRIAADPVLNPYQYGRWEFFRRVNNIPSDTFYAASPVGPNRAQIMLFATAVRAEIESRAGGPVASNQGREYTLAPADQTALTALGVDWVTLLTQMNEMRFSAASNARNYLEHYVTPSGRITRPVLTLHTTGDWLATPNHESAYFDAVQRNGNTDLLVQQFVAGGAHCTFTPDQVTTAVNAMMYWLDTGNRPDTAAFFSGPGFVPGYVPGAWPW